MSYNINFTNQAVDPVGKSPIAVAVGTVNTTATPLTLTGKGAANFGELQQANLIRLLENFANSTAPDHPTVGQVWYDSSNGILKVLVSSSPSQIWKSLGGIQVTEVGDPPPSPAALGDIWMERTGSATSVMYVYTGIGRYPTTDTTIGGWEQIWPQVDVIGGREEYDIVRELVEQLCGNPIGSFGSGAIGRSITNLTNFAELDRDLREKYKALLPIDGTRLYSPGSGTSVDREITRQAPSSTTFYYLDSDSSSDGWVGGLTANPGVTTVPDGSIYVQGVLTTLPSASLAHGVSAVENAFIIWDRGGTLTSTNPGSTPYFVARQPTAGTWEYDDNTSWTSFTPDAQCLVIGTISTRQVDDNTAYPTDKTATIWAHAVPALGTKYEHLKVEPNSQDWDTLLAAAKYAIARLEIPTSFVQAISDLPFVVDGRLPHSSLLGLNSATDVRYPSAARRSGRRASTIRQVQAFNETVNALNTAVANKFSIQGINGFTGTFPAFKTNTSIVAFASPPSPGLTGVIASGTGNLRVQFRFNTMEERNRFLGSAGGIQIEIAHSGGALAGDTNFRSLLSQAGVWRITADRTRIFGQSVPLTITQPTVNVGLWNANPTGVVMNSVSGSGFTLTLKAHRVSNIQLDLELLVTGTALAGTTSTTFRLLADNEYYSPGPNLVYPQPLPFTTTDVVDGW